MVFGDRTSLKQYFKIQEVLMLFGDRRGLMLFGDSKSLNAILRQERF